MTNSNENEFEKNYTLEELLPPKSRTRISKAMIQMGMVNFKLIDCEGQILIAEGPLSNLKQLALAPELEPIGYLQFIESDKKLAEAATMFITDFLQTNWRYQMASSVHLQTSSDDYYELLKKNTLLEESEERYKILNEALEIKVQEQVKNIEDSQRQLYETEKLASIGQLAAGIAHEVNNPMAFISCNLNTASEYLTEIKEYYENFMSSSQKMAPQVGFVQTEIEFVLSDFQKMIQESIEGAKRVTKIVSDLQEFSITDSHKRRLVDISENLEARTKHFIDSFKKRIRFVADIDKLNSTYCNHEHIYRMLFNLISNSVNAIEKYGTINIKCLMQEHNILLIVKDDGNGMDKNTLEKAFEPFFTTQEVGEGVGLGLTVSRDIVKSHGGVIGIESTLFKGTTVRVTLPVIEMAVKV
jgi:two-component system NtrC family sensor kinase